MTPTDLQSPERILSTGFRVRLARPGKSGTEELRVHKARVGLRAVGEASFASFAIDAGEKVRVTVEVLDRDVGAVHSRPTREEPEFVRESDRVFSFTVDGPRKLSLIIDGDTLGTLHLFADAHRALPAESPVVLRYGPGMHLIPGDGFLRLRSGQTLVLEHGAVLVGRGLVCDRVEDVRITGRGILDLSPWRPADTQDKKRPDTRGVDVRFSKRILIEDVTFLNPNHYTVLVGQSEDVTVRNIKTFSSALWGDGVDCMSTRRLTVEDVFLRTSDDCIAIYGHRWDFHGDSSDIVVRDSQLWADVAHPVLIGTHGYHQGEGDRIERIVLRNIDMLLHDEPLEEYQGAIALNAGDNNTLSDILAEDIRIEEIRSGQVVNIRVFQNEAYNPQPGRRIERVRLRDVIYRGPDKPSVVHGFSSDRSVEDVEFDRCIFNGHVLEHAGDGGVAVGPFAERIRFVAGPTGS